MRSPRITCGKDGEDITSKIANPAGFILVDGIFLEWNFRWWIIRERNVRSKVNHQTI